MEKGGEGVQFPYLSLFTYFFFYQFTFSRSSPVLRHIYFSKFLLLSPPPPAHLPPFLFCHLYPLIQCQPLHLHSPSMQVYCALSIFTSLRFLPPPLSFFYVCIYFPFLPYPFLCIYFSPPLLSFFSLYVYTSNPSP